MSSQTMLVGFFLVDGTPVSVETPVVGRPRDQYAELDRLVRLQVPKAKSYTRTGSIIENRDEAHKGPVEITPGMVLRNLFVDDGGRKESIRAVGKVFFQGQPCEILLIFGAGAGVVNIALKPRIGSTSLIKFSNSLNPQRLATELPVLIKEVLGGHEQFLELNLVTK